MLNRAYSLLEIKQVDEDARVITGIATTPAADRLNDVVEPEGAQFKLPLPLLWQHQSDQPIGQVTHAKVSKAGIEIVAKIAKGVTAEIDRAWSLIKAGLVPGLSIGFKPLEHEFIPETKGIRFKKWVWLELSAVTIGAHQDATITTIRSLDTAQRAVLGQQTPHRVVHLNPPSALGRSQHIVAQEGMTMKTIAEQISALEAKRMASASRMEAVMQKTMDEERTSDAAEQEEFDKLNADVEAIDKDLVRLRAVEKAKAFTARPVLKADTARDGADMRSNSIVVRAQPKLDDGILFTRITKARIVARMDQENKVEVASKMYGSDSEVVALIKANEVVAGSNLSGNWAAALTGAEASAIADFAAYLRKGTILGKFGTNGIPSLRTVPFRMPLVSSTGAGAAYWTGEAKPKGLTSFNFARTTLEPLKCANIAVLTEENVRSSNPSSDAIVRDELRNAIVEAVDLAFVDPANSGTSLVKPASITNGAGTVVSSGDTADDIRLDLRSLFAKFHGANNPPSTGVLIMPTDVAIAAAMMTNALGQPEFPSMGLGSGANATGTLVGFPVIVSDHLNDVVILVNASDIYEGGDGTVAVDMSREASLEMKSTGFTQDATVGTGTSLVSLWQSNLVGLRAEIEINWKRRRTSAVAYLTSVDWGGEPHTA
jgi:HK97 family phage prohead protease